MQCASSITSRPTRDAISGSTSSRKRRLAKRSGATSSRSISSRSIASTIPLHSSVLSLVMRPARTPPSSPASIWLRISDSKRRDEQRRARAPVAEQLGGDEVDRALAPPGALHHERAAALLDEGADGLELVAAEVGVVADERAECGARLVAEVGHGVGACHAGETAECRWLTNIGRSRDFRP